MRELLKSTGIGIAIFIFGILYLTAFFIPAWEIAQAFGYSEDEVLIAKGILALLLIIGVVHLIRRG